MMQVPWGMGACIVTAKYPHVTVRLMGESDNAFVILGRVTDAMRAAGISEDEVKAFLREALSNDYHHLLATCMRYVNVE